MQDRGTTVRVLVKMEAKFLPEADSFNVVGELRGRERPDEIVLVSGHFDSWDVGTDTAAALTSNRTTKARPQTPEARLLTR